MSKKGNFYFENGSTGGVNTIDLYYRMYSFRFKTLIFFSWTETNLVSGKEYIT